MQKLFLTIITFALFFTNQIRAEVHCQDLVLKVHQGANFVLLQENKIWTGDAYLYGQVDFMMAMSPYGAPLIQLVGNFETGEYTTAQDLGTIDFDAITELPLDGYTKDEGTDFVIGIKYREPGGSCAGLNMSHKVFAIKTADQLYAIIKVVKAAYGVITIKSCVQDDGTNFFN